MLHRESGVHAPTPTTTMLAPVTLLLSLVASIPLARPGDEPQVLFDVTRATSMYQAFEQVAVTSAGDVRVVALELGDADLDGTDGGYAFLATSRSTGLPLWEVTSPKYADLDAFALDPTGTRLFTSFADGAPNFLRREFIRDASDGTIERDLGTMSAAIGVFWSGDGSALVRWGTVLVQAEWRTLLTALSATDSSFLWTADLPGRSVGAIGFGYECLPTPTPDGSRIVVPARPYGAPYNGALVLYGLDAADGSLDWTYDFSATSELSMLEMAPDASLVLVGTGHVASADDSPRLFGLDPADGSVAVEVPLPVRPELLVPSPDSRSVAVGGDAVLGTQAAPDYGTFELALVDLDSNAVAWHDTQVANARQGHLSFAPGGATLHHVTSYLNTVRLHAWSTALGPSPGPVEVTAERRLVAVDVDVREGTPGGDPILRVLGLGYRTDETPVDPDSPPKTLVRDSFDAGDGALVLSLAPPTFGGLEQTFDSFGAVRPLPGEDAFLVASDLPEPQIGSPSGRTGVLVQKRSSIDGGLIEPQFAWEPSSSQAPPERIGLAFSASGDVLAGITEAGVSTLYPITFDFPPSLFGSTPSFWPHLTAASPPYRTRHAWVGDDARFAWLLRNDVESPTDGAALWMEHTPLGWLEASVTGAIEEFDIVDAPYGDHYFEAFQLDDSDPATVLRRATTTSPFLDWLRVLPSAPGLRGVELACGDALMMVGVLDDPQAPAARAARWDPDTGDVLWERTLDGGPIAFVLDVHQPLGSPYFHVYGDRELRPEHGPATPNPGVLLTYRIADGSLVSEVDLPIDASTRRGRRFDGAIVDLDSVNRIGVLRQPDWQELVPAAGDDGEPYLAVVDVKTGTELTRTSSIPHQSFVPVRDDAGRIFVPGRAVAGGDGSFDGRVTVLELPSLMSGPDEMSLASGGPFVFHVDQPEDAAGRFYLIATSATGTSPGVPVGAATPLPIVQDWLTNLALGWANNSEWPGFMGLLDANGDARGALVIEPGSDPALAGLQLYFAALVLDPIGGSTPLVTQPVVHTLVP